MQLDNKNIRRLYFSGPHLNIFLQLTSIILQAYKWKPSNIENTSLSTIIKT